MLVVTPSLALKVNRTAIGDKGVSQINIYMLKEILVHKISVTLLIFAVQTYIFVKINRGDIAKINVAYFIPFYKLFIGAEWR